MAIWIWMGVNPAGQDGHLGSVLLFTLEEAMRHYARELRRAVRCV